MAHGGPHGPGQDIPVPRDEINAPTPSTRGPATSPSFIGIRGVQGPRESLGGTTTGTATGRAVSELLVSAPGAFTTRTEQITGKQGEEGQTRTKTTASPQERERQQVVRNLRAGGPTGREAEFGPSGPEFLGVKAVGGTPKSGRTRGAVATGGAAGGGPAGGGEPIFAGEGNFRSGVLGAGLFSDTTGLSAIDKLNPRR